MLWRDLQSKVWEIYKGHPQVGGDPELRVVTHNDEGLSHFIPVKRIEIVYQFKHSDGIIYTNNGRPYILFHTEE